MESLFEGRAEAWAVSNMLAYSGLAGLVMMLASDVCVDQNFLPVIAALPLIGAWLWRFPGARCGPTPKFWHTLLRGRR
jgi:hypothetical protein